MQYLEQWSPTNSAPGTTTVFSTFIKNTSKNSDRQFIRQKLDKATKSSLHRVIFVLYVLFLLHWSIFRLYILILLSYGESVTYITWALLTFEKYETINYDVCSTRSYSRNILVCRKEMNNALEWSLETTVPVLAANV